jgi:hypothetical protein
MATVIAGVSMMRWLNWPDGKQTGPGERRHRVCTLWPGTHRNRPGDSAHGPGKSNASVIAGIISAAGITATKFIAAALSGSAAMLATGIHSGVDTGNNLLLYLGQRRSARPGDAHHPFGYGLELYFWTLIVALLIFTIASLATVAKGVVHLYAAGGGFRPRLD